MDPFCVKMYVKNLQEFSAMQDELNKAVFAQLTPRMVKLTGFAKDGSLVSEASGFLYTTDAANIVTCNRVRFFTDPQQPHQQQEVAVLKAMYQDYTEEEVQVLTPPHEPMDLMLLRGTRRAATKLLAGYPATGDTVYAAGFAPETSSVSVGKGMIGSASHTAIAVGIRADDSWSGGPVVNNFGRLLGVISKGAGATTLTEAIPAPQLHVFVVKHGAPGLTG